MVDGGENGVGGRGGSDVKKDGFVRMMGEEKEEQNKGFGMGMGLVMRELLLTSSPRAHKHHSDCFLQ